jgi:Flp pilus assembly protein TadD
MQPTLKYLSAACASALLMACADVGQRTVPAVAHANAGAGATADNAYLIGREQHLAGRYAQAAQSYQDALRIDPSHLKASNGLATLHAEQGDYASAITLWRQLTNGLTASGPADAYLFSNLGYAYILSGDYAQAITPLERACILDPLSHRAWRHLGDALAKQGQDERARVMYKQADALNAHDIKADYALARGSGVAPIDGAMARAATSDGLALSELHQAANGMFELRRTSASAATAAPVPAPVSAPVVAVAAPPPAPSNAIVTVPLDAAPGPERPEPALTDSVRLEIRNGNGVTGMARRMARSLTGKTGDAGLRVVRLSNEKGFNVARTRVEYQPGFEAAASRLAEQFANATVEEVAGGQSADVRLVIGRDIMRSKAEARRIIKAALARAARAG